MPIAAVYEFTNGMVMVFDEAGHQMPEYQGRLEEVRKKINDAAPDVPWSYGSWRGRRTQKSNIEG